MWFELELADTRYFGLQFEVEGAEDMQWLCPTKPIKKQLVGDQVYAMRVQARFYPEHPDALADEQAKSVQVAFQARFDLI